MPFKKNTEQKQHQQNKRKTKPKTKKATKLKKERFNLLNNAVKRLQSKQDGCRMTSR